MDYIVNYHIILRTKHALCDQFVFLIDEEFNILSLNRWMEFCGLKND